MARVEEDDLGADIEKGSGSVRTIEKVVNDLDDKYCPMWLFVLRILLRLTAATIAFVSFMNGRTQIAALIVYVMFATAILSSIISFVLRKSKRKMKGPTVLRRDPLELQKCTCYKFGGYIVLGLCGILYLGSAIQNMGTPYGIWICSIEAE